MFADMQTVAEMSTRDGESIYLIVGASNVKPYLRPEVRFIINFIKERARDVKVGDGNFSFSISDKIAECMRIYNIHKWDLLGPVSYELSTQHNGTINGIYTEVSLNPKDETVSIRAYYDD